MKIQRNFGGDDMSIRSEDYFTAEEIREFADSVCDKTKEYILKYIDMDISDFNPDVVDVYTEPKTTMSDVVTVELDDGEYTVSESIILPFGRWSSPKIPQKYIDNLADKLAKAFGDALWSDMNDITRGWGN